MKYVSVTDKFAVAPQISLEDIVTIKEMGFKTIINNRPDGEVEGQPNSGDVQQASESHGLKYIHLPIISGTLPSEAIEETKSHLQQCQPPVFAFCRSGTRSITLWALSHQGEDNKEEIISAVKTAGYDLPFLEHFL